MTYIRVLGLIWIQKIGDKKYLFDLLDTQCTQLKHILSYYTLTWAPWDFLKPTLSFDP